VDAQRLDPETDTPIIGERHEDVTFYLGHADIDADLKKALLGVRKGDAVKASLPDPEQPDAAQEKGRYLLTVVDTKRRELPELDDAFVKELTNERFSTVDELHADVRRQVESQWNKVIEESFEDEVITKMIDLHEFEVPSSIVDTYLDWYVENVRKQGGGTLPPEFDEEDFRTNRRDEAERMARWMLIREKIVDMEQLDVTEEELDEAFENKDADEAGSGASMRMLFQQHYPDMIEQMERRILNRKLFEAIASHAKVEEKDWPARDQHT
jgi:trigger factor